MLVTMSDKELSRINVIQSVVEKRMRRRDAAHQLALTERQTQRLMNRFRESSAAGLANLRRRGRPGNHILPESLKLRVLSLLHDHYSDFGPTLAAEKLRERHNITVSAETSLLPTCQRLRGARERVAGREVATPLLVCQGG